MLTCSSAFAVNVNFDYVSGVIIFIIIIIITYSTNALAKCS